MRNILILVSLFFCVSSQLIGQTTSDTLYLKNGSMVWGKIQERNKSRYSIKTQDGYIFTFAPEEVDRFIPGRELVGGYEVQRPRGIGFTMQSGMQIGPSDDVFFLLFSFTPMVTYTINNIHSLSAGTGVELYDEVMMPVFAEYKVSFSQKRLTPFFYIKGGVLISLAPDENTSYYSMDYRPGSTFGTGIGLSWPFGRYDSYIQAGYRYSFIHNFYEYKDGGGYEDVEEYYINRLDITFGFKF